MAISEHAMFILDRAGPRPAVGSKTKMKNTFVHGFSVVFGLRQNGSIGRDCNGSIK
jgi:hypothetical protein